MILRAATILQRFDPKLIVWRHIFARIHEHNQLVVCKVTSIKLYLHQTGLFYSD